MAAAQVLQSASSVAGGDMATLLATLNGGSTPQAQAALRQLSGETQVSGARMAHALADNFAARIRDRMDSVAAPASSGGAPSLASLKLAWNGDIAGSVGQLLGDAPQAGKPWSLKAAADGAGSGNGGTGGMWGRTFGLWDTIKADNGAGAAGFKANTAGVQIGSDSKVADDTLLGGSLAYSNTALNYDDQSAKNAVITVQAGAYLSHRAGDWTLDGALSYSRYDNDTSRAVLANQAKANYNAGAWTLSGEAGYRYAPDEGLRLEPSLGLQATRYRQDSYTESGAPGANLVVAEKSAGSLLSTLGLRVTREIREDGEPRGEVGVSAAWMREFGSLDSSITASFAAAPGAGSFTASGARKTRDALRLGAGASIKTNRKTRWFADYSATLKQEQTTQLLMAGVRAEF